MTRQNLKGAGAQMPGTVSLSRLLRGGTLVALALSTGGVLAGCALVGDGAQSGQASVSGQSGAASAHAGAAGAGEIPASGASDEQAMSVPAERGMSGEYEVGPDGKLLNPNKDLTPPQVPELAKEHSKEGAEALARYYTELLPYIHMTGDTTHLQKIAHSDCAFCMEVAKKIQDLHAAGGWTTGLSYDVSSVGPTFEIPDHPGIWNVDIHVTRSAASVYDGKILKTYEGGEETAHIQMQYEHGQWRLWAVGQ